MPAPLPPSLTPTVSRAAAAPGKKARKPKDKNAPKQALSAFMYFSSDQRAKVSVLCVRAGGSLAFEQWNAFSWKVETRMGGLCRSPNPTPPLTSHPPQVKEDNPDIKFTEIGKVLGERWKALGPEEKAPYEDMAKQDKVGGGWWVVGGGWWVVGGGWWVVGGGWWQPVLCVSVRVGAVGLGQARCWQRWLRCTASFHEHIPAVLFWGWRLGAQTRCCAVSLDIGAGHMVYCRSDTLVRRRRMRPSSRGQRRGQGGRGATLTWEGRMQRGWRWMGVGMSESDGMTGALEWSW